MYIYQYIETLIITIVLGIILIEPVSAFMSIYANTISEYKLKMNAEFSDDELKDLDQTVIDRLKCDLDSRMNPANFIFGIHAFATLVIPKFNKQCRHYQWYKCFELSTKDAKKSADRNGADGLIQDMAGKKFRYAARVRRRSSLPATVESGLSVRLATRNATRMSADSEFLKLVTRAESKESVRTSGQTLPDYCTIDRAKTEHPAFQITAIVGNSCDTDVEIRVASAPEIVKAVDAGLDKEASKAMDRILWKKIVTNNDIEDLKKGALPGLFIDTRCNDSVFLWISDKLFISTSKYYVGPT